LLRSSATDGHSKRPTNCLGNCGAVLHTSVSPSIWRWFTLSPHVLLSSKPKRSRNHAGLLCIGNGERAGRARRVASSLGSKSKPCQDKSSQVKSDSFQRLKLDSTLHSLLKATPQERTDRFTLPPHCMLSSLSLSLSRWYTAPLPLVTTLPVRSLPPFACLGRAQSFGPF